MIRGENFTENLNSAHKIFQMTFKALRMADLKIGTDEKKYCETDLIMQ